MPWIRLPWVRLPEGVPAFAEYYDWKQLWPAASQQRRSRLAPLIDAYRATLGSSPA